MNNILKEYLDKLYLIENVDQYDNLVQNLNRSLCNNNFDLTIIHTIKEKQKYMTTNFSRKATNDSMMKSKDKLTHYLEELLHKNEYENEKQKYLKEYLHNFYFFLEAFHERNPHKKSTLKFDILQSIKIENEYDFQHLLYSVLKPLCNDIRLEVSQDTGCNTTRADILIPSLHTIIETKCTRKNMSYNKLIEEIRADIVHYQEKYIYFCIYDKEKLIDKPAFESTFNQSFDQKHIHVIILQPIYL